MILFLGIVRMILIKKVEYQVQNHFFPEIIVGTCYRIWGTLEFLCYIRNAATFCHAVTDIEMEQGAIFSLRSYHHWRVPMGNVQCGNTWI